MSAVTRCVVKKYQRRIIFLAFTLVFLLNACQGASETDITITDNPEPTQKATSVIPTSKPQEAPVAAAATIPPHSDPTIAAAPKTLSDEELIEGVDWFLLIEDQSGEVLLTWNENESFQPASMIKIPTAMVVLKILEEQGKTVNDLFSYGISDRNFADLLEAMVVRSEENATDALEFFARGDDHLRKTLDEWGLQQTTFDPRRSTAGNLMTSLRLLKDGSVLGPEYNQFLLDLMGKYTENDETLLGKFNNTLPECQFFNKRGTLLNPTIAADMGILICGEQTWFFVVAGTPAAYSHVTFEDIQASIEAFALYFSESITSLP